MSCQNCSQKITEDIAQQQKAYAEAKDKAEKTGQWYGVYQEAGEWIVAVYEPGKYFYRQIFSP